MKKLVYKVYSISDYRGGAEDKVQTWVRIDQLLYDGPAFAEMDSTVYDMDDFKDIHQLYINIANASHEFEYDYSVYTKHIANMKKAFAGVDMKKLMEELNGK